MLPDLNSHTATLYYQPETSIGTKKKWVIKTYFIFADYRIQSSKTNPVTTVWVTATTRRSSNRPHLMTSDPEHTMLHGWYQTVIGDWMHATLLWWIGRKLLDQEVELFRRKIKFTSKLAFQQNIVWLTQELYLRW